MSDEITVRVHLSPPFRSWADGQKEINLKVDGSTLKDLIQALVAQYPQFGKLSLTDDATLHNRAIFVQDARILSLTERVRPEVPVQVLVPIAGGAGRSS